MSFEESSVERSAFSVWRSAVSLTTLTVSARAPTSSLRSTRTGLPAETRRAVCLSSRKPWSEAPRS